MAYTINKTDGSVVATITDGTINTSTSLTLIGKSYSGFGELLNENLVKILENSASTSAPSAPLKGELWFDTNTGQLKVYDGTAFEPTGGAKSQSTEPTSASAGDLWHDTDDDQLYVYSGSAFVLVGPVYSSSQTLSGWKIETLASSGGDKVVSSMYAGNSRVAMLSKETFTPSVTQTGFATVKAGITLNSTLGAVFEGTNTSATFIDTSGTTNGAGNLVAGGNFVRTDAESTMAAKLTINDNDGIVIGAGSDLTVNVSSNDVIFTQGQADKDIIFKINDSSGGGAGTTILTLDGSETAVSIAGNVTITGNLSVSGEYANTTSNIKTIDDAFIKTNNGNGEVDSGLIVETSDTDDARMFYEVGTNRWMAGEGGNYSQVITDVNATTNGATSQGSVLKTDSSGTFTVAGVTLSSVGSISEGDTSNATVPTVGAVVTFGDLWGGSAKTVSTSNPTSGDGDNGDFWFVREA